MDYPNRKKIAGKLTNLFFYFSILFFLIAFNFQDNKSGGWIQQFIPNTNGVSINDIIFIDSLNGFITHQHHIIRTTNGGTNWFVQVTDSSAFFSKIQFSGNTGYILTALYLYKTTDRGNNWFTVPLPSAIQFAQDMSVLNKDTLFIAESSFSGILAKSLNGGNTWTTVYNGSNPPDKIYYVDGRVGFFGTGTTLNKTTNGGYNFFQLNTDTYRDIHFLDTLYGWKTHSTGGNMKKTTNGGSDWITYGLVPTGSYSQFTIYSSAIEKFSLLNIDTTIWGFSSNVIRYPNNQWRGFIQKTTNNGINWGFQIPDTSYRINAYNIGTFIDLKYGWAFSLTNTGVHTSVGGNDTTYYITTGINNQNQNIVAKDFILYQNYPNPFNQTTKIKYQIKNKEVRSLKLEVRIKIYDITGKEITTLVNENKLEGEYFVSFNARNLSSGIYFYKLEILDGKGNYAFDVKKMTLIK
jgi:hypothetical protein